MKGKRVNRHDFLAAKANAPAKSCAQCGRRVNLRDHRCLYCGEACLVQSAFELL